MLPQKCPNLPKALLQFFSCLAFGARPKTVLLTSTELVTPPLKDIPHKTEAVLSHDVSHFAHGGVSVISVTYVIATGVAEPVPILRGHQVDTSVCLYRNDISMKESAI